MNELIVATIIFCSWPGGDGWTIHTTMPSIEACESKQADAIRREALPPNERALEDQRRLWWVNEYHDSYGYDVHHVNEFSLNQTWDAGVPDADFPDIDLKAFKPRFAMLNESEWQEFMGQFFIEIQINKFTESQKVEIISIIGSLHEMYRSRPWYSRFWRWIKGGDGE